MPTTENDGLHSHRFPELFNSGNVPESSGNNSGKFQGISWNCRESFREFREWIPGLNVSGNFQGISGNFRESRHEFRENSRGISGNAWNFREFRESFREFQGKYQGISGKFQGNFREYFREFHGIPGFWNHSRHRRCLDGGWDGGWYGGWYGCVRPRHSAAPA